MSRFKEKLEKLIMFNKLEQAINELFNAFSNYDVEDYEIKDLKRQLIILSSSWHDLNEKARINIVNFEDYNQNKNRITNSFLSLIDGLSNYPNLFAFINKNEKPKSVSSPNIYTTANETPYPVLLWKRYNMIEDNDEYDKKISLPSIIDIEESISNLQRLIPETSILKKIKLYSIEIDKIIHDFNLEGFTGNEKSSGLLDSILKYSDDIEKLILKIKRTPNNVELKERAILPKFTIINKGDLPAINIVILIEKHKDFSFITKEVLNNKNISIPSERPKHIERIIDLVLNFEQKRFNSKKRSMNISNIHNVGGNIHIGDMITHHFNQNELLRKYSFKIENRNLRLDFNGSIKPDFFEEISTENVFIASNLKKGEERTLKYWCYADNLRQKIEGNLIIHGK